MSHKKEEEQINELLDENKKLRDSVVKYAETAQELRDNCSDQKLDLAGQVNQLTMWNRQLTQALRDSHINYPLEWDMQISQSEATAKQAQDIRNAAYQHMRQSLYTIYHSMLLQIRDVFSSAFAELEEAKKLCDENGSGQNTGAPAAK